MMLNRQEIEPYLSAFREYQKNGGGRGPQWLNQLREDAIASFAKLGFPTTHHEDWKYTSVGPLAATVFEHDRRGHDTKADAAQALRALSFADPALYRSLYRLVFVNGVFAPELSGLDGLPAGVRVENLAKSLRRGDEILRAHLSRYARYHEHPFAALNTAFIEDGALVAIPKCGVLEESIHLVFVSTDADPPVVSHPRNLIIVEEGGQARIVESHVGTGGGVYFANAVTEIFGGEGAAIDHYLLQREGDAGFHIGTVEARLSRQCNLSAHCITLAGSLVRNDLHVVLDGEGSECSLNGLYLVDGKQHVDNHTEIEHWTPRGRSQELYKGILSGSARGVFNGKILVHKDAQKTDARQTNKNLLLSENAVIHTKPQLEIHADDVKCSHGSTVGQLDRDALFYLRSRGISLAESQSLLCYAFASEVVSRLKIAPLRSGLDDYLLMKFRNHRQADSQ
jgi:Fe-S cluster assembly protein SufD